MAEPRMYADFWDVDRRLTELGLDRRNLIEVVKAAAAAVAGCTDNDPPMAKGWDCWRSATRRLREIYRSEGWIKDDTSNFSTILNHKTHIRLAVANTDDATGNSKVYPTNRSRKGSTSDNASRINQGILPFAEWHSETEPTAVAIPGYATWYLCLYLEGEHVRAELSLPTLLEAGYFAAWSERILLISSDDDWHGSLKPVIDEDNGPEFEVEVRRK